MFIYIAFFEKWKDQVYALCNTNPDLNKTSALLDEVLKSALASPRPNPNPLSHPLAQIAALPLLLDTDEIAAPVVATAAPMVAASDEVPLIVEPTECISSEPFQHLLGIYYSVSFLFSLVAYPLLSLLLFIYFGFLIFIYSLSHKNAF
jgi:hypothetical protein